MTPADLAVIESAATLQEEVALDIRDAHNINFLAPTWEGEAAAEAYHDKLKATADGLHALLDAAIGPGKLVSEAT